MSYFFLLLSLLTYKPNFCSCVPPGPIDEQQYNEYSLIVKGKVAKVSVSNFETNYKGKDGQSTVKITSPREEGECAIFPKVGEKWLMFAYADGKGYRTNICTRTKNMNPNAWNYRKDEINDDIKFLEAKLTTNIR